MTSKEYWAEFNKTLEDDEKDFLKKNKDEINIFVRQYGRGYIEEIITIYRLQKDKTLMENTRKYIVEVFKHIIQIIDNYSEATGKSKWDIIDVNGNTVKGTYTILLLNNKKLCKYGGNKGFDENLIRSMKMNNYGNNNINDLMYLIANFRSSCDKFTDINIYMFNEMKPQYKKYLNNLIYLFYGNPYDTVKNMGQHIRLLRIPYHMSCFINKFMNAKHNKINTDCTSAIDNPQKTEFSILFNERLYEKDFEDRQPLKAIGRIESIPITTNPHYIHTINCNKTYMAGYSGTTVALTYLFLMFDIDEITLKQKISYTIYSILFACSILHHSCHEILSSINMLLYPEGQNNDLIHILDYKPHQPYSDIMQVLNIHRLSI